MTRMHRTRYRRSIMRKHQSKILDFAKRRFLPLIEIEKGLQHPVLGSGLMDCCAHATVPESHLREDLFWEFNKQAGFGHCFWPLEKNIELATKQFSAIDWNGPTRWCDDLQLSHQIKIQRGALLVAAFNLGLSIRYFDASLLSAEIKLPLQFASSLKQNACKDVAR